MLSLLIAASLAAPDMRPVHHYRRTNGDGSEAEDIYVFVEASDRVAVMKEKLRCTNAAYVTAKIDSETGQARELTGGRLTRDGTQEAAAWLVAEKGGTQLSIRLATDPRSVHLEDRIAVRPPSHLYDFDFADMAAHPPDAVGAGADFDFDLPLFLTTQGGYNFSNRGRVFLKGAARVRHFGAPSIRYRASGAAGRGALWFDARSGVLIEARLPLANHSEYRDFRLRLLRTRYGESAWKAALADHWRGCAE